MKPYPDAIRFLRQARYLNEAGYTVPMYDFRNHGNSERGTIPWVTWGPEEAKDIVAAVDFISRHEDYKDASIGLFSICMGQGASTSAFGMEDGLQNYDNIKCMISVQPMDYPTFVNAMGLPGFLANGVGMVIEKRTGMDFAASSWVPRIKDIKVPTLVIQNRNDGYLDEPFVDAYFESLEVEKEMLPRSPRSGRTPSPTGPPRTSGSARTPSRFSPGSTSTCDEGKEGTGSRCFARWRSHHGFASWTQAGARRARRARDP